MIEVLGDEQKFVTPEVLIPDEVLPPNAIVRGDEGLPDGFIPSEPIPVGFVLRTVLTTAELMDPASSRKFLKNGRRLRYKHGREAVFTTQNALSIAYRPAESDSIALAEFIRHDAQPLPLPTRIKRATSRRVFGIKCDINF